MKKYLFMIAGLLIGSVHVWGQVVIIPAPHQPGYFMIDDIWRVTLVSTQSNPVKAVLQMRIEDAQHQAIFTSVSPEITVRPGSNRPEFSALGASNQYGIGKSSSIFRSTGRLPYGNYIICYELYSVSSHALLGENCTEENVRPFSPPELVSPYNREEINSTTPLLTWKSPFPPGSTPVEYILVLKEVKKGQAAPEALEKNLPIISLRGLSATTLPFPGSAPKLEPGKEYTWQVTAKAGDFDLGTTDMWVFKVASPEALLALPALNRFRELKLVPDGGLNQIRQKLRFVYNNRFGGANLEYNGSTAGNITFAVYPLGDRSAPLTFTYSSTALLIGMNNITINLTTATGITNNKDYLLVLTDPTGEEYYLEFTYFN